jgi:hypothetical protein
MHEPNGCLYEGCILGSSSCETSGRTGGQRVFGSGGSVEAVVLIDVIVVIDDGSTILKCDKL